MKIEFGLSVNTINRATDQELFSNRDKYTIIYDGKMKNRLVNEYGENDFLITYDGKYYLYFRHFKTNRRHQHDYNFHFFTRDGAIFVRTAIKGKNAMSFERPLRNVTQAGGNSRSEAIE